MAMNDRTVIVGCGPGSPDFVTDAARKAVGRAEILVGHSRLLSLFPDAAAEQILVEGPIGPLLDRIGESQAAGRRIAVLVSGDPGLCSLAQNVIGRFGREACLVIPAVSSVQVAFARLGLDWSDARVVSAHGRVPAVAPEELRGCGKIAILAGTRESLQWSAAMAEALAPAHLAFLAENLTLPDERFRQIEPNRLGLADASSLSIVLLIRNSVLA